MQIWRLTLSACRHLVGKQFEYYGNVVVDTATYALVCSVPRYSMDPGDTMERIRRTLAMAGLALVLCSAVQAEVPIKVGVSIPISGGAGPQGQHVTQAIQVMASLINESGGVL